jgi:hypothetical protein
MGPIIKDKRGEFKTDISADVDGCFKLDRGGSPVGPKLK